VLQRAPFASIKFNGKISFYTKDLHINYMILKIDRNSLHIVYFLGLVEEWGGGEG
jgi:hypothetical protein